MPGFHQGHKHKSITSIKRLVSKENKGFHLHLEVIGVSNVFVLLVSENIAVSDQMPGEADPQQVEETNIELQVNANSRENITQCEPLNDCFCLFYIS